MNLLIVLRETADHHFSVALPCKRCRSHADLQVCRRTRCPNHLFQIAALGASAQLGSTKEPLVRNVCVSNHHRCGLLEYAPTTILIWTIIVGWDQVHAWAKQRTCICCERSLRFTRTAKLDDDLATVSSLDFNVTKRGERVAHRIIAFGSVAHDDGVRECRGTLHTHAGRHTNC